MIKRLFDIVVSGLGLLLLALPMAVIAVLIRVGSPGPALHWSRRVGRNNSIFLMPKFRTMRIDTPQVATHLMTEPDKWLTPIGGVLRRTSLDELPQLWSVLIGDMSIVGPRPALFNQDDLVALRTEAGVHHLVPGLTGLAQVSGRDDLPIPVKVKFDADYRARMSLLLDLEIIARTVVGAFRRSGISH
jgi:O-antigen biosynthesis protein WbqP